MPLYIEDQGTKELVEVPRTVEAEGMDAVAAWFATRNKRPLTVADFDGPVAGEK